MQIQKGFKPIIGSWLLLRIEFKSGLYLFFTSSSKKIKKFAPGEARTHGLQIMRLTRCLLRYGGLVKDRENIWFQKLIRIPTGIVGILEYSSHPD